MNDDPLHSEQSTNDELSTIRAELEASKTQLGEAVARQLRAQADFDNARKRLRREADEAGTRAVARALRPLLDQLDNLDRALANATPETFSEFAQGVTLIREGLQSGLMGSGLERVPCDGVFDPAVHEALAEEPGLDLPKGSIIAVHRSGWKLKDQLVRSAQVVVARPPEPA